MFDPGILLSLEGSMPPQALQPPTMAAERLWMSPLGENALRNGLQHADAFDREVDAWQARIAAIKASIEGVIPDPENSSKQLADISRFIE